MTISIDEWADSVEGVYLDKDGYGAPVWQCHDVWLDYLVRVGGGQQYMGYAPSDFTDSVFTHFPVNGVNGYFTKHYGTAGMRKGDVVFFGFGTAAYPTSHVAVAMASPVGNSVFCLTQNPGPTHYENLTLSGALGYLRPINVVDPITQPVIPEPSIRKNKNMFIVFYADAFGAGQPGWNVVGTPKRLVLTSQDAANNIAKQLGISQAYVCTTSAPWNKFLAASSPA
ncbi:hypothetical protein [Leucobacter japonicus]|uniref:hypothetical protein n=1 Tax=Leucobacter japonicus TaxID=1461259 RepID=UPI0006A75B39|nr:hypothetical protein [Leucobacter japonicus]